MVFKEKKKIIVFCSKVKVEEIIVQTKTKIKIKKKNEKQIMCTNIITKQNCY